MSNFEESMAAFKAEFDRILIGKAEAKGYSAGGDGGGRDTLDAVATIVGDGHPAGEILYKVKRYRAKGDPEDLVKIASWAFLIWDQHQRAAK
jgi:hypothetical protein